jgi:type III secretory pathway component EscU
MIGEGNATQGKLILCSIIAIMLISMLFVYILQALMELWIHLYLLIKEVNLK